MLRRVVFYLGIPSEVLIFLKFLPKTFDLLNVKPLKHLSVTRLIFTSLALLATVACSSSPPQDETTEVNSELNPEGEITEAATDQIPTDLTQTEPSSYTLTAQTPEPVQNEEVQEEVASEPIAKPAKKRRSSRSKRVLSQDSSTATTVAAEPAPVAEQPVAPPVEPAPVEPAPVEQPSQVPQVEASPAYTPPAVDPVLAQSSVEEPEPFYKHKFFIPGVIVALIAAFFAFRKKRY